MSMFPTSMPGIGTALKLIPRTLFIMDTQTTMDFLPGGRIIDGNAARDPDNTISVNELRPGLILGVITGSANQAATLTIGAYGASVMGTLTAAATASATAIVTNLATITEIKRRIGATGTITLTGATSSTGTVVAQAVAYSGFSVGASSGTITVGAVTLALLAGSFIGAYDGTQTPVSILAGDVFPISAVDGTGASQLVPWRLVPITYKPYYTINIINYGAYASLKTWLKTQIRTGVPGAAFDDDIT